MFLLGRMKALFNLIKININLFGDLENKLCFAILSDFKRKN